MSIEVAASLALAQWPISQELKAAEEVQARLYNLLPNSDLFVG